MTTKELGRVSLVFLALVLSGVITDTNAFTFPGLLGLILLALLTQTKIFDSEAEPEPEPEPAPKPERFELGQQVQLFDRYRLASRPQAFGRIIKFSMSNSGIEVEMLPGKNPATHKNYTMWVSPEQLRPYGYISVNARNFGG